MSTGTEQSSMSESWLPPTSNVDIGECPDLAPRLKAILSNCRLPPTHSWHPDGSWLPVTAMDLRLGSFSSRKVGYVRPTLGLADALESIGPFYNVDDAREWGASGEGLTQPFQGKDNQFLFVGTRSKARGVESLLWGERRTEIDADEMGRLTLTYYMDVKLAYVLPEARRKRLGRIMVSALGWMILQDFKVLQTASESDIDISFEAEIYSEIQTPGGMAIVDAIAEEIGLYGDTFLGGIDLSREYGY